MSIEKFTGQFKNEANGVTVLINSTIQRITNAEALGLYVYLSSKPDDWKIHYKEIMAHFNIGRNKAYSLLESLMELGLLSRHEIREKGRFKEYLYMLYLKPNCTSSPCVNLRDAVNPHAVNQHTYKEKKLQSKEYTNTSEHSSPAAGILQDTTPLELASIFAQELPDTPQPVVNVITKAIDQKSRRAIKGFREYWLAKIGRPMTAENFRSYLRGLKENCPGFLEEYTGKNGMKHKNGITVILHWENFEKYLNKTIF